MVAQPPTGFQNPVGAKQTATTKIEGQIATSNQLASKWSDRNLIIIQNIELLAFGNYYHIE